MPVNIDQLRTSLVGLVGFASVEDQLLLARTSGALTTGSPESWAAMPLVAHPTEFKRQQVIRLRAIRTRKTQTFTEVDHRSPETYQRYVRRTAGQVVTEQRRVTSALIDEILSVSKDDLIDPTRNPWLRGRQLWLQIVVRGFWHPLGHLGEYHLDHAQPEWALALHEHAVQTADRVNAPPQVLGMALYSLSCVQARLGMLERAAYNVLNAVRLNTDLCEKVELEPDLAAVRAEGLLGSLVPH